MRLLAIDPDSQWSWWAFFEDGQLFQFDRLRCMLPDAQVSWDWKTLLFRLHPDRVIVELQYLDVTKRQGYDGRKHTTRGGNVLTFQRLVEERRRIETVCHLSAIPVEGVAAQTWQTAMLHSGRGLFRATREQRKELSITVAGARTEKDMQAIGLARGWLKIQKDGAMVGKIDGLADAICIGLWWWDRTRMAPAM